MPDPFADPEAPYTPYTVPVTLSSLRARAVDLRASEAKMSFRFGGGRQVTADQGLLMKMAIAANGNVNIQSYVIGGGFQAGFRLYCSHCRATEGVEDASIFSRSDIVAPQIATFCESHRHGPSSSQTVPVETYKPVGRKFRFDE